MPMMPPATRRLPPMFLPSLFTASACCRALTVVDAPAAFAVDEMALCAARWRTRAFYEYMRAQVRRHASVLGAVRASESLTPYVMLRIRC